MSIIGHQSKSCYTQKKWVPSSRVMTKLNAPTRSKRPPAKPSAPTPGRSKAVLPGPPRTRFCQLWDHGQIEIRKIWIPCELNGYLNFSRVGKAFVIERLRINKKTGESSAIEPAYGITSTSSDHADVQQLLTTNRGHWCIENSCVEWELQIRPRHNPHRLWPRQMALCKDVRRVNHQGQRGRAIA